MVKGKLIQRKRMPFCAAHKPNWHFDKKKVYKEEIRTLSF